ncbi:MAG: hypothetical protein PVG55_02710 [Nitrospirota bacterium]|jgi:hypothetical protein
MKKYRGGNKVGKGSYWDLSSGRREDIEQEGTLPGDENSTFVRVPSMLMLLLGPVLGLLYVIALPFIGIATVLAVLLGKANVALLQVFGRTVSFGWRPVESYLSGRKRKGKGSK